MTKTTTPPRRTRVPDAGHSNNSNIYKTASGKLEVGYKDGGGIQRWKIVEGGILEARRVRDDLLSRRAKGERVTSNARLRFGDAADAWESGHVVTLRHRTQETYRTHLARLRQRFGVDRLDRIGPDDLASFVRDMREDGSAEWTIQGTLSVANQVYRYADRRLGWGSSNPVSKLEKGERAKVSQTTRKKIFSEEQIAQTIEAAAEPFKTLFLVAARTGARVSEVVGLTWADVSFEDLEDATLEFAFQVARDGVTRTPTKTDGSARTIPIDRALAEALLKFQHSRGVNGVDIKDTDFVFSTRTGRALNQRNVGRALREAQRAARLADGRMAFPILHEVDANGEPVPVPRGAVPSMHSFRHSYVSYALHHGQELHEVSLDVGHASTAVTEQVYAHVINDAKRRAAKRARMAQRAGNGGNAMEASEATPDDATPLLTP